MASPSIAAPRLEFWQSTMGGGKSALCLQHAHTAEESGLRVQLFSCKDRAGPGVITTRIGLRRGAVELHEHLDPAEVVDLSTDVVFCDEAQFHKPWQVDRLAWLVDECGVHVACYGLVTDFSGRLFDGSARLIELADECREVPAPALCWCGTRATHNGRVVGGAVVHEGEQEYIAGTDPHGEGFAPYYRPLCRRHWRRRDLGRGQAQAVSETAA